MNFPIIPLFGEIITTEVTTDPTTTEPLVTTFSVSELITDLSTWSGLSETLTSGIMGAIALGLVLFVGVRINKAIKKSRRGYYR